MYGTNSHGLAAVPCFMSIVRQGCLVLSSLVILIVEFRWRRLRRAWLRAQMLIYIFVALGKLG